MKQNRAITIKAAAKALQCSTQPISWQFGNVEAFERIGEAYVDMAFDEPNLVRFVAANHGLHFKTRQLRGVWRLHRQAENLPL